MNKNLLKGILKNELRKKNYKIKNEKIEISKEALEILKNKYSTKEEIKKIREKISNIIETYIEKSYLSWKDMHFRLEGNCSFEDFLKSDYFKKCQKIEIFVKKYLDKRIESDVLFVIDNFIDFPSYIMPRL